MKSAAALWRGVAAHHLLWKQSPIRTIRPITVFLGKAKIVSNCTCYESHETLEVSRQLQSPVLHEYLQRVYSSTAMLQAGIFVLYFSFIGFVIGKLLIWRKNLRVARKSGFVVLKSPYNALIYVLSLTDAYTAYIPLTCGGWHFILNLCHYWKDYLRRGPTDGSRG